jgi:sugar O-acyltransferase (sialic acid O-acetyltransferase NeuD family)
MRKRKLIIVGAAGHGREVAYTFLLNHPAEDFLGFLDDASQGTTPEGWPILGKVEDWPQWKDSEFIVAINDPRTRRSVVAIMKSLGAPDWGGVIHPSVLPHPSVKLGCGFMILGGVAMTVNITLGNFVSINRLVALGHDCVLGDFTAIGPLASISGNVSSGCGVDIGTSAAIRQGVSLGEGCGIGMGAVVVGEVPNNELGVGNPARLLRMLTPW